MNRFIFRQNGVLVIFSKHKMNFKAMRSMRVCLIFTLLLFGMLPVYVLMNLLVLQHRQYEYETRIQQVCEIGRNLTGKIEQNGYLENPSQAELSAELSAMAEAFDGRIFLINRDLVMVKDTAGREEGRTLISGEAIRALGGTEYAGYEKASETVKVILPLHLSGEDKETQVIGALFFYSGTETLATEHRRLGENAALLLVGSFVMILTVTLVVSRMLTRSLRTLSARIDSITESNDGRSLLEGRSFYEVEQIAEAFERMMQRMAATEKSRQEFVSNVSHELKTPLTAIKVLSDSLVLEPDVPIEMYQEFIADINSEIDREAKIVNDLLSLVKLDKTEGEMNLGEVNINKLLETILRRLKPLALKRGIEMTLESYRTVVAQVDEVKLSLVFTNLIENAIKYNRDGGRVMVSLNSDHRYFYVRVEDTGIGIPEEEQGMIFERFYRVDKARSRENGGSGLGLSITKSAVQMHRGAIKVQSVPGVGSIFTVRIPLSFALVVQ